MGNFQGDFRGGTSVLGLLSGGGYPGGANVQNSAVLQRLLLLRRSRAFIGKVVIGWTAADGCDSLV